MKILVTGASRGVGRSVAEQLQGLGHQVRAMVRSPEHARRLTDAWTSRPGLQPVLADVTDRASLDAVVQGCDALIHAAGRVGEAFTPDDERAAYDVNVAGTGHLWRAAGAAGVRSAVFISSVAVYGRPSVPEVYEDAPRAHPDGTYERTKAAAEGVALELGHLLHMPTCVLRPSVVYGPHDRQFLPRVVAAMQLGLYLFVGDPDRPMSVCFVDHITECCAAALRTPAAAGQAFNVLDAELPTWRQFVSLVAQEANLPMPRRTVSPEAALALGKALDRVRARGRRPGLDSLTRHTARVLGTTCVYRIDKARRLLGYAPQQDLLSAAPALVRAVLQRQSG